MAEPSEFDVEDALPRLVNARPPSLPHTIPIVVGGEVHEHEVPVPEPEDPQPDVREIRQDPEQAPDSQIQVPLSDADLARELDEFREADQRRLFGVDSSQVMDFNRRQEIISELNADYYKDSEPDEEYVQDDDELDDDEDDDEDDEEDNEINEDFQRIPEDPEYPPPADVDLGQTSDLQADNSEVTVQIDSRTENPCLQTHDDITQVGEAEQAQQYCNSVQIPGTPSGLNGSMSVQAQELTVTEAAALMAGDPNDPTPTTEETDSSEIIMQINPSSSLIDERTLVASPTPELLLPGTSHTVDSIVICKSNLELPSSAATDQRISESGESVLQKPAPATASISEGESMQKPAGAGESEITSSEG